MDVADQRAIEQRFCFYPEVVAAFAITFCVGNQTVDQFEDVLFAVYVGKRVVVHGLFEVDGVEEFDTVIFRLQQLPAFDQDTAFRVLSIKKKKKVNYFYEVTTSD